MVETGVPTIEIFFACFFCHITANSVCRDTSVKPILWLASCKRWRKPGLATHSCTFDESSLSIERVKCSYTHLVLLIYIKYKIDFTATLVPLHEGSLLFICKIYEAVRDKFN